MQLSVEELIKFRAIKEGSLAIVISDLGQVVIGQQSPPEDYEPHPVKEVMLAIYIQVSDGGVAYLKHDGYNFLIYKRPLVHIILNDVEFLGWNRKGTPVLKIDGEELSGYTAISKKLYGTVRSDMASILKPYLIKEFDPKLLRFVEHRKVRGNTYPVFRYGSSKKLLKGVKGIKEEFPQLTVEEIKAFEPKDMEPILSRHDELIKKFDLERVKEGYVVTDPTDLNKDVTLTSQRQVIAYIKSHGESISRDTAKRIFESL